MELLLLPSVLAGLVLGYFWAFFYKPGGNLRQSGPRWFGLLLIVALAFPIDNAIIQWVENMLKPVMSTLHGKSLMRPFMHAALVLAAGLSCKMHRAARDRVHLRKYGRRQKSSELPPPVTD